MCEIVRKRSAVYGACLDDHWSLTSDKGVWPFCSRGLMAQTSHDYIGSSVLIPNSPGKTRKAIERYGGSAQRMM